MYCQCFKIFIYLQQVISLVGLKEQRILLSLDFFASVHSKSGSIQKETEFKEVVLS